MLLHRFLFLSLLALARAQEEEEGDAESSSSVRPVQASGSANSTASNSMTTRTSALPIASLPAAARQSRDLTDSAPVPPMTRGGAGIGPSDDYLAPDSAASLGISGLALAGAIVLQMV